MTIILNHHIQTDGILRLTLNDTSKRNALSNHMMHVLANNLKEAETNPEIKIIIIAANGPAFCAGHDLKEITAARTDKDKGQAAFTTLIKNCSVLMQSIVQHSKPVIAEVNGIATAAGCQLVASCDLAYASPISKFATPGVNIGLFCSTPMVALSRNLSHKHAMEMLLTGQMVTALKAAEIGLINQVIPDKELTSTVMSIARKIAHKSASTIKRGKKAFYQQSSMSLQDAYNYTSQIMVENMLAVDSQEGINAFLEKRAPKWTD